LAQKSHAKCVALLLSIDKLLMMRRVVRMMMMLIMMVMPGRMILRHSKPRHCKHHNSKQKKLFHGNSV
jgi:hypothetical protein